MPLIGTRKTSRLDEALRAVAIHLGPDDLARIEAAIPPDALAGERYAPAQMQMLDPEVVGWGLVGGQPLGVGRPGPADHASAQVSFVAV